MRKAARTRHTKSALLSPLDQHLQEHLLALDYAAFQQVMKELLLCSGYDGVRMMGRRHTRGRTHHGGHDLLARTHTDVASSLTLVQVKQYERVVSRRFVDELRGTLLRLGAQQGLLLTTSSFSRVAKQAARQGDLASITLLDGKAVCDLMREHRLGVRLEKDGEAVLDANFFDKWPKKRRSTYGNGIAGTGSPSSSRKLDHSQSPCSSDSNSPFPSPADQSANVIARDEKGGAMLWRTHVLVGLNTLWLLELLPHGLSVENLPPVITAAAFGSLLPDLDAAESKIKHLSIARIKPFYLPALAVHRHFGHRGFSHSLAALALVATLCVPLAFVLSWQVWLALLLGYASHLAADSCTRSGIPLLYPSRRRYHLLPSHLRFTTGSQAEETLLPLLAILLLLFLLRQIPLAFESGQ